MHELGYHDSSIFLTLTYDDLNLPADEQLDKSCLQRFFKRLRKQLGKRKIKYYAAGEYGQNGDMRPHYHAIIFGLSLSDSDKEILQKCWTYGFLYYGTVTVKSCRYTANYIQKNDSLEANGGRLPPFSVMSLGIGKQFVIDNAVQLRENLGTTIQGHKTALPSYYRKKLEIEPHLLTRRILERDLDIIENHYKRVKWDGSMARSLLLSKIQNEKNLIAQDTQRKKGRL